MTWSPEGGNWEGGRRDSYGRRWVHEPNKGWRLDDSPPPFREPLADVEYTVRKMSVSMPASEEMAMEYGLIPDTRPAPTPPTWRQRARTWTRQKVNDLRWRVAAKIGGTSREGIEEISSLW